MVSRLVNISQDIGTRMGAFAFVLALVFALTPAVNTLNAQELPESITQDAASESNPYTPLGAERQGNAEGSIPPWTGGITTPPENYDPGRHEVDPFPDDKPLYTINASNADDYQDILGPGQMALLQTYPDTWRLNVYRTRRSAALPEWVYDGIERNGTNIDPSVPLGKPLYEVARIGPPFPFPVTGEQVLWNHNLRWRGLRIKRALANTPVTQRGFYLLVRGEWDIAFPYGTPEVTEFSRRHPNVMVALISKLTSPSLLANSASLVLEPIDHVESRRSTWVYLNSLRRVIRRPFQGYGFPSANTDSLRTIDEFELFNGATDRFDWQLLGKREMLIPYNSYRLHSSDLNTDDIVQAGHINPDLARYELHRVWVVEGRLKKGEKHPYSRKIYYVDEDTWQVARSESYDRSGKLWRVAEAHALNFYTIPVTLSTLDVFHDLKNNRYLLEGLDNELEPFRFLNRADSREFSPNTLLFHVR